MKLEGGECGILYSDHPSRSCWGSSLRLPQTLHLNEGHRIPALHKMIWLLLYQPKTLNLCLWTQVQTSQLLQAQRTSLASPVCAQTSDFLRNAHLALFTAWPRKIRSFNSKNSVFQIQVLVRRCLITQHTQHLYQSLKKNKIYFCEVGSGGKIQGFWLGTLFCMSATWP